MGMNRFKLARLEKGLRQIDVARAAHVGEGYLSRIETGRVNPKPEIIHRIAQALNVNPDFFAVDLSDGEEMLCIVEGESKFLEDK